METTISTYEQQALDFLNATQTKFTTEFKEFGSMSWDKDGSKRNIFNVTLENARHKYTFVFGSSVADSCGEQSVIYTNDKTSVYMGFRQGLADSGIYFGYSIKTDYPTLLKVHEGKAELSINDKELKESYSNYLDTIKTYNTKLKRMANPRFSEALSIDQIQAKIRKAITDKIEKSFDEKVKGGIQADNIIHPSAYDCLACLEKYEPGTLEDFCGNYGYDTDSRSAVRVYKEVRKQYKALTKLFTESEIEQLQEIN